jgi:hypothetical protein
VPDNGDLIRIGPVEESDDGRRQQSGNQPPKGSESGLIGNEAGNEFRRQEHLDLKNDFVGGVVAFTDINDDRLICLSGVQHTQNLVLEPEVFFPTAQIPAPASREAGRALGPSSGPFVCPLVVAFRRDSAEKRCFPRSHQKNRRPARVKKFFSVVSRRALTAGERRKEKNFLRRIAGRGFEWGGEGKQGFKVDSFL